MLIDVYRELTGKDDILLAAPTGRAAKRMAESTGMLEAKTIHSALGLYSDDSEGEFSINDGLVIIDEMSMVDLKLAYKLFSSIKDNSMIVLVGDADQLPSVGAGNVFADIISSGCVACTRLDTVFRQSGASRIALNAEKIRTNDSKLLYGSDFNFIETETENDTLEVVKKCYLDEIKAIGIDNVQVLAPFKARGDISVKNINEIVREIINPYVGERNELFCDGKKLRLNDKVIQTKNKDTINNGDVGFITSVYDDDGEKHAIIEFADRLKVEYSERDLDIIELAYATTIHKSQGSEYSTVIIPIRMSQYITVSDCEAECAKYGCCTSTAADDAECLINCDKGILDFEPTDEMYFTGELKSVVQKYCGERKNRMTESEFEMLQKELSQELRCILKGKELL